MPFVAEPAEIDVLPVPATESSLLEPSLMEPNPAQRVSHALDRLEDLAALLAVEDDYEPAERDFDLPRGFRLSVVIPVFNEERTIQKVLSRVAALPVPKEIIVVDDASTDGTRQLLSQYEAAEGVHVIFKPSNEGKGAALRTGFRRASGDVIVVQDADLEYDPRDILLLIKPIVLGEADVVYGSRFLGQQPLGEQPQACSPGHRLGNRLLTAASNFLTGLSLTDMETCYKAFRQAALRSFEIQQNRFGFEPEVTARIARRGFKVREVPIRYSARSYAEGKKIGLRDLISTLWCILRYGLWD